MITRLVLSPDSTTPEPRQRRDGSEWLWTLGLTRLAREFPSVAVEARSRALAVEPHVRVREWRSLQFDPLAYDAPIRGQRPPTLYVAGPRDGEGAAAALQILTRYQSLVLRRNAASATELFSVVLARHRELHDTSKPLVAADYWHSLDAWQWTLRLCPNASVELQLAALLHDLERLESEAEARVEHHAADYQAFKNDHAREGGRLAAAFLRTLGVGPTERARVQQLIEQHEVPSDDRELAILGDADALSFFSLNSAGYLDYFGREQMRRKIAYTLARLRRESVARLATVRYRADVERLVVAALVRRPEVADWPAPLAKPEVVVPAPAESRVPSTIALMASATAPGVATASAPAHPEPLALASGEAENEDLEGSPLAEATGGVPRQGRGAAKALELLPVAEAELLESPGPEQEASVGSWTAVRASELGWLGTASVEGALGWLAANEDLPAPAPRVVEAEAPLEEVGPPSISSAPTDPEPRLAAEPRPVAAPLAAADAGENARTAAAPPGGWGDPTSPAFWQRPADARWARSSDPGSRALLAPDEVPPRPMRAADPAAASAPEIPLPAGASPDWTPAAPPRASAPEIPLPAGASLDWTPMAPPRASAAPSAVILPWHSAKGQASGSAPRTSPTTTPSWLTTSPWGPIPSPPLTPFESDLFAPVPAEPGSQPRGALHAARAPASPAPVASASPPGDATASPDGTLPAGAGGPVRSCEERARR